MKGPKCGYFPEPSKSILVVQPHNVATAEKAFAELDFTVVTGSRYLGGFMGEASEQDTWVRGKTVDWVAAIRELSKVAERFPQAAYAGLSKSLQHEWQFLQRVTKGLSNEFRDVEKALHHDFLPALFGEEKVDDAIRQLSSLPVKKASIAIPNPMTNNNNNS